MSSPHEAAVDLRGCRALVTGGAGLIGSHITDDLIRAGAVRRSWCSTTLFAARRANLEWALANGR